MTNLLATIRATLCLVATSAVAPATWAAKHAHHRAGGYAATQGWTFDGGDALVIQVNALGSDEPLVFIIRVGDTVRSIQSSSYRGIDGVFANPPMWLIEAIAGDSTPTPCAMPWDVAA